MSKYRKSAEELLLSIDDDDIEDFVDDLIIVFQTYTKIGKISKKERKKVIKKFKKLKKSIRGEYNV